MLSRCCNSVRPCKCRSDSAYPVLSPGIVSWNKYYFGCPTFNDSLTAQNESNVREQITHDSSMSLDCVCYAIHFNFNGSGC